MEDELDILLPFGYITPTDEDIKKGKSYVLKRERFARGLSSLIDALLLEAAEKITKLCYQYDVNPQNFQITSSYNKELFEKISEILDELENQIIELINDYSTRCTENKDRKAVLIAWLMLLGRDNLTLRQTLETRLLAFKKDLEAMIVATKKAKYDVSKAIARIKSSLHSVYVMPEMKPVFANATTFKAQNIKSRGIKYKNFGNSNSEANNITRFARITLQMTWMRNQVIDFKEKGVNGYIQLRGSDYPCSICDSETGFFTNINEIYTKPLPHPNCMCYRVPVYKNDEFKNE